METPNNRKGCDEYSSHPRTLVGVAITDHAFLIDRISASIEINHHESAPQAKVREAMDIQADYPTEELSTNIYRIYDANIIEEGIISIQKAQPCLEITEPLDMAKAGRFNYYVCGTLLKKGAGSCQSRYLNTEKFEGLVINKIKEHILTEDNLRELARLVNEEMDSVESSHPD